MNDLIIEINVRKPFHIWDGSWKIKVESKYDEMELTMKIREAIDKLIF